MPAERHNGTAPRKKRLLTGLRPTGKFHLGNYVGTFEKDLELQDSGEYECFFLIADYHTLTTGYETASTIGDDIRDVYAEAKASGFDIKALRTIVRMRKQDADERREHEAILETYMHALGMLN